MLVGLIEGACIPKSTINIRKSGLQVHIKTTHVLLQRSPAEQLAEPIKSAAQTCFITTWDVFIVDERLSSFMRDSLPLYMSSRRPATAQLTLHF